MPPPVSEYCEECGSSGRCSIVQPPSRPHCKMIYNSVDHPSLGDKSTFMVDVCDTRVWNRALIEYKPCRCRESMGGIDEDTTDEYLNQLHCPDEEHAPSTVKHFERSIDEASARALLKKFVQVPLESKACSKITLWNTRCKDEYFPEGRYRDKQMYNENRQEPGDKWTFEAMEEEVEEERLARTKKSKTGSSAS